MDKNDIGKRKIYMIRYREDNAEKIKRKTKQWCEGNRERIKEKKEQWDKDNPEYGMQYYKDNREKILERHKLWNKNHPERMKEAIKKWHENNVEGIKLYCENNKEKIREYHTGWMKKKRKTDEKYNLNGRISSEIYKSLRGNKKGRHWEILVGYTLNDLLKHLKKTMPKGYAWQDYLEGNLHIDHKIPISAFNFTKSEHIDFRRCWALENLRLLLAKENLIKHDRLNKSFQPALQI